MIFDAAGNLYGTSHYGGNSGNGIVFELSPASDGRWQMTTLHTFNYDAGKDGEFPSAGLVFDGTGNLYGTTSQGGTGICDFGSGYGAGCGSVFEVSPIAGGGWKVVLLHSFVQDGIDGTAPQAGLILDGDGNLYSTTTYGGTYGLGTVFELMEQEAEAGPKKFCIVLAAATMERTQAALCSLMPLVIFTARQVLGGGVHGLGTVFELSPQTDGNYSEKILHIFNPQGSEGTYRSQSALVWDNVGNLYGTTSLGGESTNSDGTVFELLPSAGGNWKVKWLHSFGEGTDGSGPQTGVVFDSAGNLYGTTWGGGAYGNGTAGSGTLFELSPTASGNWAEKVLHSFGNGTDGGDPYNIPILDS